MKLELPLELIRIMIEDGRRIVLDYLGMEYNPETKIDDKMFNIFKDDKIVELGEYHLPEISGIDTLTPEDKFLLAVNIYENANAIDYEEV